MDNKRNIKIFVLIIIVLILGTITTVLFRSDVVPSGPGKYDGFAQCLKDKGAVFYGAYWCSHCIATKKMFGPSQKLLPYVECSNKDGSEQLQICKDKKVEGYPTWIFADGSKLAGEVAIQQLAEKTSCLLPQ